MAALHAYGLNWPREIVKTGAECREPHPRSKQKKCKHHYPIFDIFHRVSNSIPQVSNVRTSLYSSRTLTLPAVQGFVLTIVERPKSVDIRRFSVRMFKALTSLKGKGRNLNGGGATSVQWKYGLSRPIHEDEDPFIE